MRERGENDDGKTWKEKRKQADRGRGQEGNWYFLFISKVPAPVTKVVMY